MGTPDGADGAAPVLPGLFHGVVLDLDGLLVETEQVWSRAKELLFERHGVAIAPEDYLAVLGTSDEASAIVFARRFGLPAERAEDVRREYAAIADELLHAPVTVTAGARELVAWLRGRVPLALASNTRRPLVERILASAALADAFDAVVTGDDGRAKPAPDLYLLACRHLGVDPTMSVALEDSPTGVAAARAAGLRCIGVPSSPDVRLDAADHVVRSLLEVIPSPTERAEAERAA